MNTVRIIGLEVGIGVLAWGSVAALALAFLVVLIAWLRAIRREEEVRREGRSHGRVIFYQAIGRVRERRLSDLVATARDRLGSGDLDATAKLLCEIQRGLISDDPYRAPRGALGEDEE